MPKVFEICAGAGGQALGLELAGFECMAAVEIDKNACETLRKNRPTWNVIEEDVKKVSGKKYEGVDLFAGGVPCPPFSIAGKQLGEKDERDLFPEAIRLIRECSPKAFMLENVKGFASPKFSYYRENLEKVFFKLGFITDWKVLNSSDYGVPQLRPRFIMVGLRKEYFPFFRWPVAQAQPVTVAKVLGGLLKKSGWKGLDEWSVKADKIAPTIVGGSKKHGGPDLGPTRAKKEWEKLGVDAKGIAELGPDSNSSAKKPFKLTLRMAARIQGFPDSWDFTGGKTAAYRQIGNAFPPPVAEQVGRSIFTAIEKDPKVLKEYPDLFFESFRVSEIFMKYGKSKIKHSKVTSVGRRK
jgi:DNA (cytosine-5)-methyltransferase 1